VVNTLCDNTIRTAYWCVFFSLTASRCHYHTRLAIPTRSIAAARLGAAARPAGWGPPLPLDHPEPEPLPLAAAPRRTRRSSLPLLYLGRAARCWLQPPPRGPLRPLGPTAQQSTHASPVLERAEGYAACRAKSARLGLGCSAGLTLQRHPLISASHHIRTQSPLPQEKKNGQFFWQLSSTSSTCGKSARASASSAACRGPQWPPTLAHARAESSNNSSLESTA